LEELSQIVGVPLITPEEQFREYHSFLEKFPEAMKTLSQRVETLTRQKVKVPEEELDETINYYIAQFNSMLRFQVGMAEQSKRISEAMKTIPFQKEALKMSFPGHEEAIRMGPTSLANEMKKREKISKEAYEKKTLEDYEHYQEDIEKFWSREFTKGPSRMQRIIEAYDVPTTSKEDSMKQEAAKAVDEITKSINESIINRKRLALQELEAKSTAGVQEQKEVPLYQLYRASGLYGGGGFGGKSQEEAILKRMLGKEESSMLLEATGFRGSALHRKKQKEFIDKYSEYGKVQIEGLVEDLDNMITGHYDVLYKSATGEKRLVDIKTVFRAEDFSKIQKIAEEMQEKKLNLNEYINRIGILDKGISTRLRGYLSQVNFYLSKNMDALGELLVVSMEDPSKEIRIETGRFDPALLDKDVRAVKDARQKIYHLIENIQAGPGREKFMSELPKTASVETLRRLEKTVAELSKEEEMI